METEWASTRPPAAQFLWIQGFAQPHSRVFERTVTRLLPFTRSELAGYWTDVSREA
jgi:hypothetical protein